MRALSPREARLVAVLILIALIALVQGLVIGPIISGFAARSAERADLTLRYAANDRMIAAIPRLRRQAQARNAALAGFALHAPDHATATQLLRERLQGQVAAVGGDFRGAEDLSAATGTAACRVRARLTSEQLYRLLALAQNARPALVITSLVIGADDALVTARAATLDVQLDASIPVLAAATR